MGRPEHNEATGEQGETQKRRCPPDKALRSHGEPSPSTSSPGPLYADPGWIAANFPTFREQVVRNLRRQGHPEDRALEAFHEAVVALYETRPNKTTRREVNHFLRMVAFQKARKAAHASARVDVGVERPDEPDDLTAHLAPEARQAFRATVEALFALSPRSRRLLLEKLCAELVAMGAPDAATVVGGFLDALGDETGSAGEVRMRLARARQQLRAKVRGWLVGFPALRAWHRDGWSVDLRGLGLAAGAIFVVAAGVSLPQQTSSAAQPTLPITVPLTVVTTTTVTAPQAPGGQWPVPESGLRGTEPDVPDSPAGEGSAESAQQPTPLSRYPTTEVELGGSDRDAGNHALLCFKNLPTVPDTCVPHPLRKPGTSGEPLGGDK